MSLSTRTRWAALVRGWGWFWKFSLEIAVAASAVGTAKSNTEDLHIQKESSMDRSELKGRIDELMRQYQDGEIDGSTYSRKMMELTTSEQE